jgi:glutamate synthase domain-containing protein 2
VEDRALRPVEDAPDVPRPRRASPVYRPDVMDDIHVKAELGRYRFRGFGTLRPRPLPSFDDLTFLPCSLTRIPLEGYRERCRTKTVLGARYARHPVELDIPVMITGMSFGALSYNAKVALSRGARAAGTSTTTGDGGMLPAERENTRVLI